MDEVNVVVLESFVVILSGGTDKAGVPILTFPVDSVDLMDIYQTRDILDLMTSFVDLCGGKVVLLADVSHGWAPECITKLFNLFDKLQTFRKRCISAVYLIQTADTGTFSDTLLLRPMSRNKALSTYTINYLNSLDELYTYIDRDQLTTDYGGTLQYNHVTWVDFQRTYLPLVTKAGMVIKVLPRLEEIIFKYQEEIMNQCDNCEETFRKIVKTKYEQLLESHDVRDIVEDCQDAVDRLEHPDCDPTLIQTHVAIVTDTKQKLTSKLGQLEKYLSNLNSVVARSRNEHLLFAKLEDCKNNTKEVEETIELMTSQADGLPLVSSSEEQAKYNRELFNDTVLVPSQDIVSCATSILQDLSCDTDTSSSVYMMAETVAKRLSESIQPFIQHLNHLNEVYTRLHLFHVIVSKTKRWNKKASNFLTKQLLRKHRDAHSSDIQKINKVITTKTRLNRAPVVPRLKLHVEEKDEYDDRSLTDCTRGSCRINPPVNWDISLDKFYHKHPPPKKKQIKMLTKFAPSNVEQKCRMEAEILAERTLFILQVLLKQEFKVEELYMIEKWSHHNEDTGLEHGTEVSLV